MKQWEKKGVSVSRRTMKWMNVYVAGVPWEEEIEQKKTFEIDHDHDFSKFVKNC